MGLTVGPAWGSRSPPPALGRGIGSVSGIRRQRARWQGLPATHRVGAAGGKGTSRQAWAAHLFGVFGPPRKQDEPPQLWPSPAWEGRSESGCPHVGLEGMTAWAPTSHGPGLCVPLAWQRAGGGVSGEVGPGEGGAFRYAWFFLSCRHCPWARHFLKKRKHMSPYFLSESKQ